LYSQASIVNDEYFVLLDDPENRGTIINYCLHNDLTVDIIPVSINFPGVGGERGSFVFGYKFVHLMSVHNHSEKRKFYPRRVSAPRDLGRIDGWQKL